MDHVSMSVLFDKIKQFIASYNGHVSVNTRDHETFDVYDEEAVDLMYSKSSHTETISLTDSLENALNITYNFTTKEYTAQNFNTSTLEYEDISVKDALKMFVEYTPID